MTTLQNYNGPSLGGSSVGGLGSTGATTGPIFGGVPRKLPTSLALCPVIDATKSSEAFGQGITTICAQTAETLAQTMANFKLGLHITRDLDYDRDANFSLGNDLSVDEFKNNLTRIAFEGGGDALETQFDAVQTAARTFPWDLSPTARRAIVLCSSSGSKPTRDGKDAVQLAVELNALNIKVVVVAPTGVNLHELAKATRGASLDLTNTPSTADIQHVIKMLTRTLTQMAGSAGGHTMVVPPNTQFGHNGTQVLGTAP